MIKVRATIGKADTVILGLTTENWERLIDNQPIMFPGKQIGLDVDQLIIIGGTDITAIREDLRAIGVPLT